MMINLYHRVKLRKNSMLHQMHLEHRMEKMKSELSIEEKNFAILTMTKRYFPDKNFSDIEKKIYVLQEYNQIIKKKILIDKLNSYKKFTKKLKSFSILVMPLILKEKVLKPFWTEYTADKSKRIWLPTDCIDLNLDTHLKNQIQNSWFSTNFQTSHRHLNSQETLCGQSLQKIDKPNIKKKKHKKKKGDKLNAINLRIYPSKEQKRIISKWVGASRWIYNRCLYYINNEREKPGYKSSEVLDIKNLRNKFVNNSNYETENKWMQEVNYDIRDEAIRDLKDNFNSNFAKKEYFEIKYRTRKKNSVSVLGKHWAHKKGEYSKVFKNLNCEKPLPKNLKYSSRIIKTETNEYYICIPRLLIIKSNYENQITRPNKELKRYNQSDRCLKSIISIDPGVRTFMTCYDPNGCIIEFGKNDIGMLARLNHHKFKLQSRIKTSTHSKSYKLTKSFKRISLKIKNLVTDCHKKLSKWLCTNYNTIIIPKLNFHSFGKMSKKNRSKMVIWNHCAFVDRLVNKSREYLGCKVMVVTEEYTSKTCGCCGNINYNLGASKIYNCDKCKTVIDRDVNGARNILLKHFTEKVK